MLDEHKDCGFVYGGYSFVDNEINKPTWLGGRQVEEPYLGEPFNPRDLEDHNYIDGSYPLRKEVYWGAAEKMGQEEGLWDPSIKSLQDWDFWLSVVKGYGSKGHYSPSKFFETTYPHEGGLSYDSSNNWLARVKQIQAKHGIKQSPICVCSPAAEFHGRSVAKVLNADYRHFPPAKPHDYKAIYMIGFFTSNFLWTKSHFMSPNFLGQFQVLRAKGEWDGNMPMSGAKKYIHFIGSDVTQLRKLTIEQLGVIKQFLNECEGVFAEIDTIAKELLTFGIKADVVPFPPRKWFPREDKMPKKKAIAIYLPEGADIFYMRDYFLGSGKEKGLIHMMKDVTFHVFGNNFETMPVGAKNYKIWGRPDGVQDIIKETNAIVRITPHDGLPISVAEWIGAGRNALTTIKMPHANHFDLAGFVNKNKHNIKVKELLKELKESIYETLEKPVNIKGSEFYKDWLDMDKYREAIKSYGEYDEKRYWEKRADSWNQQAQVDKVKKDKLRGIIQSLSFKSVLDVGCGNGRFVSMFDGKEYAGFDISKRLIEICEDRYPDKHFFISSVEDLTYHDTNNVDGKVDLIFCYTTLEHVPPEYIGQAVEALKKVGKNMLLIEPKDFIPAGNYCFNHDYKKLFNVRKRWGMGDKNAYLIKL